LKKGKREGKEVLIVPYPERKGEEEKKTPLKNYSGGDLAKSLPKYFDGKKRKGKVRHESQTGKRKSNQYLSREKRERKEKKNHLIKESILFIYLGEGGSGLR